MGPIYTVYSKDHRFTGRYGALRPIRCGHACTRGVPERYAGPLPSAWPLGSMYIGPHETSMGLIYIVYSKDHRFTGRYGALRPIMWGHACTRGVPERYAGPLPSAWPPGSM